MLYGGNWGRYSMDGDLGGNAPFLDIGKGVNNMTLERAIEILDPEGNWRGSAPKDVEEVKEACRVACKAMRRQASTVKLYAVTKGCYSDYYIITLQRDKTRAENIAKIYGGEVNEYDEDNYTDTGIWWRGVVDYAGDARCYINTCGDEGEGIEERVDAMGQKWYWVRLQAMDKEHALKKLHDMVAQYKAEHEGAL